MFSDLSQSENVCEFLRFYPKYCTCRFSGLTVEVHYSHRFDSRKSGFITRRTPVKLRYGTVPYRTVEYGTSTVPVQEPYCIENVLYRTVRLSIRKMCEVKFDFRKVG